MDIHDEENIGCYEMATEYIRCEMTPTSAGGEQQNYISGGILEKFVIGQKEKQKMTEIKVITIGRHYCAGGSTIGKLVAEKLGIPCYDREIIDMMVSSQPQRC